MDNVYMGRGSDQLHTFWLPFHDIDLATGGLVVVEGSSQRPGMARLRETFGMQEQFVTLGQDPAELTACDPSARWVTAEYEAGDLVVFGSESILSSPSCYMRCNLQMECATKPSTRMTLMCFCSVVVSFDPPHSAHTAWRRHQFNGHGSLVCGQPLPAVVART